MEISTQNLETLKSLYSTRERLMEIRDILNDNTKFETHTPQGRKADKAQNWMEVPELLFRHKVDVSVPVPQSNGRTYYKGVQLDFAMLFSNTPEIAVIQPMLIQALLRQLEKEIADIERRITEIP